MLYFFLQLVETIKTHYIFIFEVFVAYAWIIYLIKFHFAMKYKPITKPYRTTTAVIVPVLKEDIELFRKCLKSIKAQKPDEFYIVLDRLENDVKLRETAKRNILPML